MSVPDPGVADVCATLYLLHSCCHDSWLLPRHVIRFVLFFPDGAGGKVPENPGTRVRVEGLNHDVMDEDIKELFAGVGELLHCAVRLV